MRTVRIRSAFSSIPALEVEKRSHEMVLTNTGLIERIGSRFVDFTAQPAYNLSMTYTFKVVVEPDEDRWFAYCPALESKGGATWGHTKEEALRNIFEVVQLVIESMKKHGEAIPTEPSDEVQVSEEAPVTVIA